MGRGSRKLLHLPCYRGAVVAERLRPLTSIPEVPGSNPGPAVAPLGKALYPSLPSVSEETLSRRSHV